MLYNNLSELLRLLDANNLFTEKRLGQNFLYNPKIIEKILQTAQIAKDDLIVEIGPGLGLLTKELTQTATKVITIEKDPKLIPYLQRLFQDQPNLELVNRDVLAWQPPAQKYKVVANIPYYITSPIINHFLQTDQEKRPETLTILTQLEVAQKICARRGDHSVLSLQTQLYADPQLIDQVGPENFYPAPKVKSAILKLTTLAKPRLTNDAVFIDIIKKAFSQKRKTLSNSLQGYRQLSKDAIEQALVSAGLKTSVRPQELDFPDWEKLIASIGP